MSRHQLPDHPNLDAAILESVDAIIVVLDPLGRIMRFNRVVEKISGFAAEEVLGAFFWDVLMTPDDAAAMKGAFQDIHNYPVPEHVETPMVCKGGRKRHIVWSSKTLRDPSGRIKLLIGSGNDITEMMETQKALNNSETRLYQIINLVPHGVYVKDASGRFVLANDAAAAVFGLSRDGMLGKTIAEIHPNPEEAARCMTEDMDIMATGRAKVIQEETLTGRDGERRYFRTHKVPFFMGGSHAPAVLGVSVEFTESRKNLEELELLSMAMEQSTAGIAAVDINGYILFCNKAFAGMHGLDAKAIVGEHLKIFHTEAQMGAVNKANLELLERGTFSGEVWHVRQDGSEFPGYMNNFLLRDDKEKAIGVIGTLRDVTEQRKTRIALRQSESMYRTTVEALPSGVAVLDMDYNILFVNKTLHQWHERFHERPRIGDGHPLSACPILGGSVLDAFQEVIATGNEAVSELTFSANHREMFYRVHRLPVFEKGEIVRLVMVVEDLTDSKNAEAAMIRASRLEATTTLAGGIAHDFNNLMSNVLGNAELLLKRGDCSDEAGRMLRTVVKNAERAGELAQLLVAFARGGKYQPDVVDLNDVFKENFLLQESSLPARIDFVHHLQEDIWAVEADAVQIGQVMINLCLNAVDAVSGNGRIVVATANVQVREKDRSRYRSLAPGRYVRLAVKDTGCGMDKATQAKVFEPFFSTKQQGRGLGLSAVFGIVKNHGGEIMIQSRPGGGSTFEVYLPAVDERAHRKGEIKLDMPRGTETILVIDDDDSVRDITRRILEYLGYKVLVAMEGNEAVELVRRHQGGIHLALLDMGMPNLGGAETFPLLREASRGMKVVIYSGYENDEASKELLSHGASAFIQKPFRMETLARVVRQALDEPQELGDG